MSIAKLHVQEDLIPINDLRILSGGGTPSNTAMMTAKMYQSALNFGQYLEQDASTYPGTIVLSLKAGGIDYLVDLEYSSDLLKIQDSMIQSKMSYSEDHVIKTRGLNAHQFYNGRVFVLGEKSVNNELDKEHLEDVGWARLQILGSFPAHANGPLTVDGVIKIGERLYNIKKLFNPGQSVNLDDDDDDDDAPSNVAASSSLFLELARFGASDKKVSAFSATAASTDNLQLSPIFRCGADALSFNSQVEGAVSTLAREFQSFYSHAVVHEDQPSNLDLISKLFPRFRKAPPFKNNSTVTTNQALRAADLGGGCSPNPRVLYMGVAADCAYSELYGNDLGKIEASILQVWNVVSGIYEETFNVKLGIIQMHVMRHCSELGEQDGLMDWNVPCQVSDSITDKLNSFSAWRGTTQSDEAGLWHLVSGCKASKIVGIAWLNQLCNTKMFRTQGSKDTVSGTGVTIAIDNMYAVVAHEIGHNFGAPHDCISEACSMHACSGPDKQSCPCCPCGAACDCKNQYIMNPESGGLSPTSFSECSIREICQKNLYYGKCLEVPGKRKIISGNVCGNGIKELGEECDCGDDEACARDPCCQKGCKLRPEAQCSDRNDACCERCKIVGADQKRVCMDSKDHCQLPSMCDGLNPECPPRKTLPDGTACTLSGDNSSVTSSNSTSTVDSYKCASGICTSRDAQCRLIGSRSAIIGACPMSQIGLYNECAMLCLSSKSSTCIYLDASFIDGTPCSGGFCYGGKCSGNVVMRVTGWLSNNKFFLYSLIIAAALVFAFICFYSLYRLIKRRQQRKDYGDIVDAPPREFPNDGSSST